MNKGIFMIKPPISPIGQTSQEAAAGRYARSAQYRAIHNHLKPYRRIAKAVIHARVAQKLSQRELAARVGVRVSTIALLESGTTSVSATLLARLGEVLGISLETPEASPDVE
jgi:ribosome-binding protein aMBF1 (putative translation factor)